MSRLGQRIVRTGLSIMAAAFLIPAIAVTPAAAQNIGTLKTLCVNAASDELSNQLRAAGKPGIAGTPELNAMCAKFVTPNGTGSDTLCPTEMGAYVKKLGLPTEPATSATCMAIYAALM